VKKLLLILLIFPVSIFSQVKQTQNVQVNISERKQTISDVINETKRANAAEAAARTNENIIVRKPITVDLYDYTHIAIVDVAIKASGGLPYGKKKWTNTYADRLKKSPLSIINPYKYDKKRAKKDPNFLKGIKEPGWLYLTIDAMKITVDWKVQMIVRDYKNKLIYSASHTNVAPSDFLYPLVGF